MKSPHLLTPFRLVCCLLSLLAWNGFGLARAQVVVEASALPSVGIGKLTGPEGATATAILTADLQRSGSLAPVTASLGDFSASGEASPAGVTGRLVNRRSGAVLLNQNFAAGNLRAATHRFADAIVLAVTGLPGIASGKIAFISKAAGAKELYTADCDGANVEQLTHDRTISASPSLSADATRVVYSSYKSGYLDTYTIALATSSRSRIAFFPGINSGGSFSPNGSQIALTLSKDGNPEIYTIPATGGTPVRITRTRGSETTPSWSPGGDRLVYCSDDRGGPQLFISSSSGISEWDHLVTGNSFCTKPDWSPNGKSIAFTTRISGQFQIGVYDLASRTAHLVTQAGGEDPAWARDSRHLIYTDGNQLHLLDTVTGRSLPINLNLGGCSEPTISR